MPTLRCLTDKVLQHGATSGPHRAASFDSTVIATEPLNWGPESTDIRQRSLMIGAEDPWMWRLHPSPPTGSHREALPVYDSGVSRGRPEARVKPNDWIAFHLAHSGDQPE